MIDKQYVIELGIQLDQKWQHDAMAKAVKATARSLYMQALTMAWGGEKPRIAVFSDDFFTGSAEIEHGVKLVDEFGQASKKVKKAAAKALWSGSVGTGKTKAAKKAGEKYGKVKDFGFGGRVKPSDYMPNTEAAIGKPAAKSFRKAIKVMERATTTPKGFKGYTSKKAKAKK